MASSEFDFQCPTEAEHLARLVAGHGGRALLVGGWVRDALLGAAAPDVDIEVFGLEPDDLRDLLAAHYRLEEIGRAFGILKLHGQNIDISVPRRENKTGPGHRGFQVAADPHLSFARAAARRDFTLNAMGYDPLTGELLDPWGGRTDLEVRRLRHTSEKFVEDPLRVLRGMQLCARFRLDPDPATVNLCRTMEREGLAPERFFPEWRKLILLGREPSRGLEFLRRTRWLRYFPELEALIGCPQDPRWHPEGDVWTHVLHCLDVFADERCGDADEDLVVGLAVLCHDLGKPATTTIEGEVVRSRGHAEAGAEIAKKFLARLNTPTALVEQILPLVREHAHVLSLHKARSSAAAIRRLARRVGRIDRLVRVVRADQLGRPPLADREVPAADWLQDQARALGVETFPPVPLIQGRHLVALGLRPGPRFKPLLDSCFQAQLDGEFMDVEGGLKYLKSLLNTRR